MTTRNPATRNKNEISQSRRMLAVDTLSAALTKDRCGMICALGSLQGSLVFTGEEIVYAESILRQLNEVDRAVCRALGDAGLDPRVINIQVRARTLVEQVAALREVAFWAVGPAGVLAMERAVHDQLAAYNGVRQLLRVLMAKDMEITIAPDPAALPQIGASPYLAFTHPELELLRSA